MRPVDGLAARAAVEIEEHDLRLWITLQIVFDFEVRLRLINAGEISERNNDHVAVTEMVTDLRGIDLLFDLLLALIQLNRPPAQINRPRDVTKDGFADPTERLVSDRRGDDVRDSCFPFVLRIGRVDRRVTGRVYVAA